MSRYGIRGITLIALVITIIVLLILAGVTTATLTGEGGILNKVETAKNENEEKTATEIINEQDMSSDQVSVGLKVKVKDIDAGDEMEFTIVGSTEADPFNGRISNESEVGKHFLGKKKGDTVEIVVPDGILNYKIVDINK